MPAVRDHERMPAIVTSRPSRSGLSAGAALRGTVVGVILVVGGLAAAGILIAADAFGLGGWALLAPVVQGILLGFLGTIPWLKVTRRVPVLLMLASVPSVVFAQFLMLWVQLIRNAQPSDLGSVWNGYVQLWEGGTIGVTFFSFVLAALVAWYAGRTFTRHWQRRQGFSGDRVKKMRKSLQIIFQDPFASLNPRMRIEEIVTEPLVIHRLAEKHELPVRAAALLEKVGLSADVMRRYPHEFSGGQRQRIGIARALASGPSFIVADEPVSALDVSVQAQIINLLEDLREELKLSFLFIAHDLNLVRHFSARVAVMYLGKIVEIAPAEGIYRNPSHPYTEALLADIPVADPTIKKKHILLKGDIPSPAQIPPGCRFHTRCIYRFEPCDKIVPRTTDLSNGHFVNCHLRG